MTRTIKVTKTATMGVLLAFAVGGFAVGTAVADDAFTSDEVDAWGVVSADELGETRGGTAVAEIDADIHQEYNGDAEAGTIDMNGGVIESSMSITAFNTGNNVVMLNTLAIDVCMDCTINEAP